MLHELVGVLIISTLIALLRGHKISSLSNTEIKGLWIFFMVFIIQFSSLFITENFSGHWFSSYIVIYFPYIHCISYQLLLACAVINFDKKYMRILFVGILLNFIVILFNDMKMPVRIPLESSNAWENYSYLQYGSDLIHTTMTKNTRFKFLADIIILDYPYPFKKIISIGDLVLIAGFGWFIQEETKKSPIR